MFVSGCGSLVMCVVVEWVIVVGGWVLFIILLDEMFVFDWFVIIVVFCGMGDVCNLLMVLFGDVCLVIGGCVGMILEVCFVWLYCWLLLLLVGCGGWLDWLLDNLFDECCNLLILLWGSVVELEVWLCELVLV